MAATYTWKTHPERKLAELVYAAGWFVAFVSLVGYAWIVDDSYITFRVLDNFVNGFGLRWNVDERVQVFSNPLWLFVHLPPYLLVRNMYLITISISALCAASAVWLMARSVSAGMLARSLFVLLPLARSRIFREQMITGLETPMTLLLLAWFWYTFMRSPQRYYRLLFIACLAMLNRLDAVVILSPVLAYTSYCMAREWLKRPNFSMIAKAALCFAPLVAWLGFCLIYYGFAFPNTAYAKLNTGRPPEMYRHFGGCYVFEQFSSYDPYSFVLIICAVFYAIHLLGQAVGRMIVQQQPLFSRQQILMLFMAAGIALHVTYVISVGGDFIPGRFLMPAFFLSALLIYTAAAEYKSRRLLLAAAAIVLFGTQGHLGRMINPHPEFCNVFDEREFYLSRGHGFITEGNLLTHVVNGDIFSARKRERFMRTNLHEARNVPRQWQLPFFFDENKRVIVWEMIGVTGYASGPGIIYIDTLALADPLLARLPAGLKWRWRPAHFRRHTPIGYEHARSTGDTSQMMPDLREYYEKLRLVTSGELFDPERLRVIVNFHRGKYDHLRHY